MKNFKLSWFLASLYLVMAVIILIGWYTADPTPEPIDWSALPNATGDSSINRRQLIELPVLPSYLLSFIFPTEPQDFFSANKVDPVFNPYILSSVILNTISWFYIGKFIQYLFTKKSKTPGKQ